MSMRGPIVLSEENINDNVKNGDIGTYILSRGNNVANYVGRSDSDLNVRLKEHLHEQEGYRQFWFELVKTSLEAYYLECQWYHKYNPSDNNNHPAVPPGASWKCSVSGCPWST